MVKKLTSRADFARRAGVSAAAVTKACSGALKPALSGKRIDAAHPAAVAYLESKSTAPAPADGIDPLYQDAVDHCTETGRWTASTLQRGLKIGYKRAQAIIALIEAAGVQQAEPKKTPHVRGPAAAKETKKRAALAKLNNADEPTEHAVPDDILRFADFTLRDLIARFGTDTAFADWLRALKSIEDIHEKRLKNAEKAGELINRKLVDEGLVATFDTMTTRMLTDGAKTIAVRAHSLTATGGTVEAVEALVAKQLSTFIRPTKAKVARVMQNV
jgi:hypothetical protein